MVQAGAIWAARAAQRRDPRSGIRERVAFVARGVGDDQVFVVVDEPPGEPVGGVLICSSLHADFLSNYQREARLARHLAAAGLVTVRFHYRGTGNSDGDPAAITLAALRDDARWAAEQLRQRLAGRPLGLVGTRWGAVTAITAAAAVPGAPLVLCEPVADTRQYFREAMRSRAMSGIASRSGDGRPFTKLPDLLAAAGYADVVGHVIHQALYDSAIGEDVLRDAGRAHPALLVQFGGTELRRDLSGFRERLAALDWTVDVAQVDVEESWWFRSGPRIDENPELNGVLGSWLAARLGAAAALR